MEVTLLNNIWKQEKIRVTISWCDKNYAATVEDDKVPGSVVATHKTLEGVKQAIASALQFHVEGMVEDGDAVPEWLASGAYELDYRLDTLL